MMIVLFFALLALAGSIEAYSEASPGPATARLRLPMNLMEAAFILSIMRLYGWQLGLAGFCFLVAWTIMMTPLARYVRKRRGSARAGV